MMMMMQDDEWSVKALGKINIASLLPNHASNLDLPVAKVDQICTNDFQYLGHYSSRQQATLLHWEEVLWLLEKRKLIFLSCPEENHSVQFYFEHWLMSTRWKENLSRYLVYCKLVAMGYVVWRCDVPYLTNAFQKNTPHLQQVQWLNSNLFQFVVFCPNAKFCKNNLPPFDYVVYVFDDGDGDRASAIDFLFEASAHYLPKDASTLVLVAHVEAGNVNFFSLTSYLPSMSESTGSKKKKAL
jgi:hypothetical protein